jgi:hypothetical protein
VEIAENGASLYLIIPVQNLFTPIGLLNKLICNDGIVKVWNLEKEMKVTLREGGIFAFLSEGKPVKATANGELVLIHQDPVNEQLFTIDCRDVEGEVFLEIKKVY